MPLSVSTTRKPPPKQARSEAKRVAILDAAEALLATRSPADITTRSVAEHAGVPVGSVYRYFKDADDLLRALFDRTNSGTVQSLHETLADETLADANLGWRDHVRRTFDHLRAMHASHPFYGVLNAYVATDGAEDADILAVLDKLMARSLPNAETARRNEIARTMMAMIDGVERRLIRLADSDRDSALNEAQTAVTAYLAHYLD